MIALKDFFLPNGLHVVVQENHDVQIAVFDIIYEVGSRDDFARNKGMAHLFEHLMFCGSENVKNFDIELQNVGGSNNAYTNLDVTNYYCSLPAVNIETAFWIEADRMFNLSLSEESIAIQKDVVIEELKESYFGTPYSDFYLHLHKNLYPEEHPYHFPTIGFEEDIRNTSREDLLNFYNFYRPDNAILVVAGNVDFDQIKSLCEKYFLRDHNKKKLIRTSDFLSVKTPAKGKIIEREVPLEHIYFVYKTCPRRDKDYCATILLAEMLDCGKSSFLYSRLVDEKKIFSSINVEFDDCELGGHLIISGMVNHDISVEKALEELSLEIENFTKDINEKDLTKAKNNLKMSFLYDNLDLTNLADMIANSFIVDDPDFANEFISKIEKINTEAIQTLARELFCEDGKNVFIYRHQQT